MLDQAFAPNKAEQEISELWEKNNLFASKIDTSKPVFSIVIPPPNVTGQLHMGTQESIYSFPNLADLV